MSDTNINYGHKGRAAINSNFYSRTLQKYLKDTENAIDFNPENFEKIGKIGDTFLEKFIENALRRILSYDEYFDFPINFPNEERKMIERPREKSGAMWTFNLPFKDFIRLATGGNKCFEDTVILWLKIRFSEKYKHNKSRVLSSPYKKNLHSLIENPLLLELTFLELENEKIKFLTTSDKEYSAEVVKKLAYMQTKKEIQFITIHIHDWLVQGMLCKEQKTNEEKRISFFPYPFDLFPNSAASLNLYIKKRIPKDDIEKESKWTIRNYTALEAGAFCDDFYQFFLLHSKSKHSYFDSKNQNFISPYEWQDSITVKFYDLIAYLHPHFLCFKGDKFYAKNINESLGIITHQLSIFCSVSLNLAFNGKFTGAQFLPYSFYGDGITKNARESKLTLYIAYPNRNREFTKRQCRIMQNDYEMSKNAMIL